MSIINNSHAIGVDTRNLVLKTRGTLHVKVGDRYYEIDFRNMIPTSSEETNEEVEEKQYIITAADKQSIESMEYPGDNKLIIGLNDRSLFVSSEGILIDVSPQTTISTPSYTESNTIQNSSAVTTLNNVSVTGLLYGNNTEVDFANNSITVDNLRVGKSFTYPKNTVTNNCCKSSALNTSYQSYDFIELNDLLDSMSVKSGVMIKSNINGDILVKIGDYENTVPFENGTYIIYKFNDGLVYTKLN